MTAVTAWLALTRIISSELKCYHTGWLTTTHSLPCRAIVTADKALLFEPHLAASRKFVEVVLQHMQARQQQWQSSPSPDQSWAAASHTEYIRWAGGKSVVA